VICSGIINPCDGSEKKTQLFCNFPFVTQKSSQQRQRWRLWLRREVNHLRVRLSHSVVCSRHDPVAPRRCTLLARGASPLARARRAVLQGDGLGCILPGLSTPRLSLYFRFHRPSSGHWRKWSLLRLEYAIRSRWSQSSGSSGVSNFFLLARRNNNQPLQLERKKLTKVEEEIQWTRNSQWGTPAGNWEPIGIQGRRGLVLPSEAPRTLPSPLTNVWHSRTQLPPQSKDLWFKSCYV